MYQRTVLIVEDEPLIRMILADTLEDEGYAVVEAETALEAIGRLGTRTIDVVITDIDMPGVLNGLDVARYVASCKKDLPVIMRGQCPLRIAPAYVFAAVQSLAFVNVVATSSRVSPVNATLFDVTDG